MLQTTQLDHTNTCLNSGVDSWLNNNTVIIITGELELSGDFQGRVKCWPLIFSTNYNFCRDCLADSCTLPAPGHINISAGSQQAVKQKINTADGCRLVHWRSTEHWSKKHLPISTLLSAPKGMVRAALFLFRWLVLFHHLFASYYYFYLKKKNPKPWSR